MEIKKTAFMIFYNDEGKILLQKRDSVSKHGEEWGFFGGKLEEGETPIQAVIREIKEELGFVIENPILVKTFEHSHANILYKENLFTSKLPDNYLEIFNLMEGDGMELFTFDEARNLKILDIDRPILDALENYLRSHK